MLESTINHGLRKIDPTRVPRDPEPSCMITRVYRIGDTEPFFQFCPAPRIYGRVVPLRWSEKQRIMANYFQCEADDIGTRELDDGIEAIVVCGEIVGSFDVAITPALGE